MRDEQKRYSRIFVRETQEEQTLNVTSKCKPDIPKAMHGRWQALLDVLTEIVEVPSGLIMQLHPDSIEVFAKSQQPENPYEVGEKAELRHGLYCENVIGKQAPLLVPDARKDPLWDDNPDVDLNMISYMGLPIIWPDGEVFGTVCLLDNKENQYDERFMRLLDLAKEHIESDLKLILANFELATINTKLHNTSTMKSKMLSLISHDVRGGVGSINEFLKLMIREYDRREPEELKADLHAMHKVASHAYVVLENLLRWSKNDLLQLEPEVVTFDLVTVFDELLDFFQLDIEEKHLQVIRKYYDDNILVEADENMLKAALRNILSNAIKYNKPYGEIEIDVGRKNNALHIAITDTGMGMDKTTVDNLFTYDNASKNLQDETIESAGIGLLMTKDFLTKNGFSITVKSQPGEGSAFILSKPLD